MAADPLTSSEAEILRTVDLAKSYGEEHAIAGVTLCASAGEVLGIVGPNGAGKTTFLEVLAGVVAADSGDVFWCGDKLKPSHRKAAMFYLPDGVRPYQDRFVIEVLKFFAGVYKRPASDLMDAIASVELQRALRKRVMPDVVEEAKELVDRPDVGLMSLMDHTPGQRQFRDEVELRDYYRRKSGGMTDAQLDALFKRRFDYQQAYVPQRTCAQSWRWRINAKYRSQVTTTPPRRTWPLRSATASRSRSFRRQWKRRPAFMRAASIS
jgi:predicted ABC-type transport system involved in lysophospholipase L1 biosynthesis ATPase subunit